MVQKFSPHKKIVVELKDSTGDLSAYGTVVSNKDGQVTLNVPKADTASVTARLLAELPASWTSPWRIR